jgi:hypothetical protein
LAEWDTEHTISPMPLDNASEELLKSRDLAVDRLELAKEHLDEAKVHFSDERGDSAFDQSDEGQEFTTRLSGRQP